MKYKSLLGVKATMQNGHSCFGYIYSEDDLGTLPLPFMRFLLMGSLVAELNYAEIHSFSFFDQDNSKLLFELVLSEPTFIYKRSLSELQKILEL